MPLPDFLCIGAQKSGTTWLYAQMKQHPKIWLPVVKELHYFDRPHIDRYIFKIFSNTKLGKFVRSTLKRMKNPKYTKWVFQFLFYKRTNQNYHLLFKPDVNQICGEITPAYARLNQSTVDQIGTLLPNTKIIFLIRNPVDRIWSQLKMNKRIRFKSENIDYDEILKIKSDFAYQNSAYTSNLEKWSKNYDSSQIFIGFFEQILQNPEELLSSIYSFLGVDSTSNFLPRDIHKAHNAGNDTKIPIDLEKSLTASLMPEIQNLHKKFNNTYTKHWLSRALEVMKDD